MKNKQIPASLRKELDSAVKQYNESRYQHRLAGESIVHKTEEYHKLPEEWARYTEWTSDPTETELSCELWANKAEEFKALYDAGLDAYLAETFKQAEEDREHYTAQAKQNAEEVLDQALILARIQGHKPERPQVTDPLNIGLLPFLDGTLESYVQSLTAEKTAKAKSKAGARENIPAYTLVGNPLFSQDGPAVCVISRNLIAACSYKPDGAEVLTPSDNIIFTDAAPITKDFPAISRRTLKGWLDASGYEDFQQLELFYTPAGLQIHVKNEAGRVITRAQFDWVKPDPKGVLRPVTLWTDIYPLEVAQFETVTA